MNFSSEASTLKWSIARFSELTECIARRFDYQADDKIVFSLYLHPLNGQLSASSCNEDLLFELICRKQVIMIDVDVPVAIQLSILDSNDHKCYTQEYQWSYSDLGGEFVAKFISRLLLFNSPEPFLSNDVLTLFCKVKILNDGSSLSKRLKRTNEIVNDYGSLLKSGDFTDVRVIVGSKEQNEGEEVKEFAAHKAILSARCEVFAAMFKHSSTKEAQESQVDIPDVRVQVFELFLQFIYTGKVSGNSLTNEYASELFEVADKYQMNSLKQYCEQYLCSNLEIESLAQTLMLADMHQASKLKSKCLQFFTKNGDQVMRTVGWSKISTIPDLLLEVIQCFVDSKTADLKTLRA